jgi:pyruvate dehydrogenase E1 component
VSDALRDVERRVLWLATSMVHAANTRPNPSGIKVGGHQASSASMVSLMTALWFDALKADDRVSVKPHASPVFHAISYLLGNLEASYMPRLRELGGLQPYPSRTKDPDRPDYSTGSVGIGATAPVWGAVARRYLTSHFDTPPGGRQISLLGDAELDEGAVWECIADPVVPRLGEVLWVVDLNRQSLDRVVPDIAATRLMRMFEAAGWQVLPVKYGRFLQSVFAGKEGEALRTRIDEMGNEEYQSLLRAPAASLRERLGVKLRDLSDDDVARALRDLGGHDLDELKAAFAAVADDRPTVMFAYTIKGWGLPIEGHPANHSALLTPQQYADLAERLGTSVDDPWASFDPGSPAAALCEETARRLRREPLADGKVPDVPESLGRAYKGEQSTQAVLGRVLVDLTRSAPDVAARVVTVSPDVASSTNTGGWINKVGVWSPEDRTDWFEGAEDILMRWKESRRGQHVELGIAETNLVGLLGELGATWLTAGEPLLPIGTVYDPFVARALEPWAFGVYGGGQSILVGTPSGVTLAAEGGAHQSVITPSIGLEQPGVTAWEPAFAQDLEWILLHCLSRLGRPGGEGAYLRLTTRPIDQALGGSPDRRDVLAGAYRLRPGTRVDVVAVGAMVPEAIAAADELGALGVDAGVVVVSSYDRLWRAAQARRGLGQCDDEGVYDRVFAGVPLVTVLDGHPHTLAFLGAALDVPVSCLGVSRFGQAGAVGDLYALHGIDTRSIVEAALDLVD